ncbi:MAG: Cation transporting ATPase, C-terminus, partial [Pseudomonadota bacterium]
GLIVLLQLVFTYAPPLRFLFETVPLAAADWAPMAGLALGLFLLVEGEKAVRAMAGRKGG